MSEDQATPAKPEEKEVWWKEVVSMLGAALAVGILWVSLAHGCSTIASYRSEYELRAEQTARIQAAACIKAARGRYECVEACRTSPSQTACIEEVNSLAPMWQPAPRGATYQ